MKPLILIIGLALAGFGCDSAPRQVFKFDRALMHTRWDFSLAASSEEKAGAAVDAAAAEIADLDEKLAMWKPESELSAFNAKAGQGPAEVSAELDSVLSLGQKTSELSQGASDVTVGPLVQLWYDWLKKGALPPRKSVSQALALVDYRKLKRLGPRSWSSEAGQRVDLGSFAKGYAQDKAAAVLRSQGIRSFLLNAGGQVYAAGHKPDGSKWSVGIINPRKPSDLVSILRLEDQCMSTSGDYEQARVIHGRRYHHIIDPKTGWPVTNGTASVTVIIPLSYPEAPGPAAWADALDTAALVKGMQDGKRFLESRNVSGVLIHEGKNGRLDAAVTDDLKGKLTLILE